MTILSKQREWQRRNLLRVQVYEYFNVYSDVF